MGRFCRIHFIVVEGMQVNFLACRMCVCVTALMSHEPAQPLPTCPQAWLLGQGSASWPCTSAHRLPAVFCFLPVPYHCVLSQYSRSVKGGGHKQTLHTLLSCNVPSKNTVSTFPLLTLPARNSCLQGQGARITSSTKPTISHIWWCVWSITLENKLPRPLSICLQNSAVPTREAVSAF